MCPISRREVPELTTRQSHVGKAGTLRRSFPTGPGEYFRIYNDEPLHLEVELLKELTNLTLVLHTNLDNYDGEWQEFEFEQIGPARYAVDIPNGKCGLFRFKVRYTLDGGKNWYWDRVPYSEVIVDPAGAACVVMYTMIPTVSGHIGQWKEQLHHIREMNFNAVHLLPVTRMGESESPYAADDLFSLDESYLDPSDERPGLDQFEDFVETAKSLGIRLCLDLVLNHVNVASRIARSCPGWIVADKSEPDGLRRAGCWHKNQWIKWRDLALINFDHPQRKVKADIWQYMTDYALFWSNYADYTGGMLRFDNLHSSHEGFITECTRAIRRDFPDIILLAEFFSDLPTLERKVPLWSLNLLLANPWEYRFAPQLREYLLFLHEVSGKLRHFAPITSHDTGSPSQEFGSPESTLARYFIMALYATGQTGIVQGVEYAVPQKVEFIGRGSDLLSHTEPVYAPFIGRVNDLLIRYKTFANSGNILFVDCGHNAILAAVRYGKCCGENDFLLLANLDLHNHHSIELNLAALEPNLPMPLHSLLDEEHLELHDPILHLTLGPSGVKAFEMQRA